MPSKNIAKALPVGTARTSHGLLTAESLTERSISLTTPRRSIRAFQLRSTPLGVTFWSIASFHVTVVSAMDIDSGIGKTELSILVGILREEKVVSSWKSTHSDESHDKDESEDRDSPKRNNENQESSTDRGSSRSGNLPDVNISPQIDGSGSSSWALREEDDSARHLLSSKLESRMVQSRRKPVGMMKLQQSH